MNERTVAPPAIYLQGYIGSVNDDGVTWCEDRIEPDDVEYALVPAWIEVDNILPTVPAGLYRIEVIAARKRGGKWVKSICYFGGSSESDPQRRFYEEGFFDSNWGGQSVSHNFFEAEYWQRTPSDPE